MSPAPRTRSGAHPFPAQVGRRRYLLTNSPSTRRPLPSIQGRPLAIYLPLPHHRFATAPSPSTRRRTLSWRGATEFERGHDDIRRGGPGCCARVCLRRVPYAGADLRWGEVGRPPPSRFETASSTPFFAVRIRALDTSMAAMAAAWLLSVTEVEEYPSTGPLFLSFLTSGPLDQQPKHT
jgi:hypothetical protein